MAYDFALDLSTGDWVFGSTRDLLGVTGPELDKQRIFIRTKIPRGSFIYDENNDLGSRLHEITRYPSQSQIDQARTYVVEALSEMDGVSIDEINIDIGEGGQLIVDVQFHPTTGLDPEEDTESEEEDVPEFDARVTID